MSFHLQARTSESLVCLITLGESFDRFTASVSFQVKALLAHQPPIVGKIQGQFIDGLRNKQTCHLQVTKLYDAHHKKTDLKADTLGEILWSDTFFYQPQRLVSPVKQSVSYQKKDGRGHVRPPFFWYDTDKDLKVCFLVTRAICGRMLFDCYQLGQGKQVFNCCDNFHYH